MNQPPVSRILPSHNGIDFKSIMPKCNTVVHTENHILDTKSTNSPKNENLWPFVRHIYPKFFDTSWINIKQTHSTCLLKFFIRVKTRNFGNLVSFDGYFRKNLSNLSQESTKLAFTLLSDHITR